MASQVKAWTRADLRAHAAEFGGAGLLAGLCGGALMMFYLVLHSEFWGAGFLLPLRLVAATVFGVDALIGGVGVVIAGLGIHVLVSIVLGIVYALIPRSTSSSFHALLGGIGYSVVVLIVATLMVLPVFNPVLRARVALTPMAWFFGHVIYGAVVGGLAMPLRRRFRPRPLL